MKNRNTTPVKSRSLSYKGRQQFLKTTLVGLLALIFSAHVAADQGDIQWRDWQFSYATDNGVGLELTNVEFKDRKILHKVSFPVMRVEYDNDVCGPYADIIWSNTYTPIELSPPYETCNDRKFCGRTFTQNNKDFLELGVNVMIGEYEIYQSYIFSPEGYFDSLVFSRGLQCETDHRHHAHWLFDFDIDGRSNDQVLKNTGNLQTAEFNDRKDSTTYWTINDAETGLKVELTPGVEDGFPDDFSQWDVAVRKWNSEEVGPWRAGARQEIGTLFNDSENIDREDIVVWYISHLNHPALEGSSKWHSSGPRVRVINP